MLDFRCRQKLRDEIIREVYIEHFLTGGEPLKIDSKDIETTMAIRYLSDKGYIYYSSDLGATENCFPVYIEVSGIDYAEQLLASDEMMKKLKEYGNKKCQSQMSICRYFCTQL